MVSFCDGVELVWFGLDGPRLLISKRGVLGIKATVRSAFTPEFD